jgi:predicted PurR-regulated permease PerM
LSPGDAIEDSGAQTARGAANGSGEGFERPPALRGLSLPVLAVLASIFALYAARAVVIPLAIAFVLSFSLSPVVRGLQRLRLPLPLAAAVVMMALVAVLAFGVWMLVEPASVWVDKLPRTLREVERELREIERPIQEFTEATQKLDEMRELGNQDKTPVMKVRGDTVQDLLVGHLRTLAVSGLLVLVLLYFLLASGDRFLEKLVRVQPHLKDKHRALTLVREIRANVSAYLLTISWINVVLGIAVGVAMQLLGMPSPALWGVMAGLLNFVPFLGAAVGIAVVTLGAIATFDGLGQIALVPLTYFALTTAEAYLLTPIVLGRRLTLSPLVIFIGLLFWSWLWGIPGALLAVPLMAVLKIVCDAIEPLEAVGEMMGR